MNKTKKGRPSSRWAKIKSHIGRSSKKRKTLYGLLVIFVVYLVGMVVFGGIYQLQHRHDKIEMGVSFAPAAATDLGMDWKANYLALLDDLKFRNFRLVSYWEDSEPTPGNYNFDDLDWQINQAAQRGAKVTLAVGLRQPRWPECHQPGWASDLEKTDKAKWQAALNNYISTVVNRYKDSPAIQSWHLENEYFNRNFGSCHDYSKARLQSEIALIHKLDPNHPVVITLADQLGFPFFGPFGDKLATSLYRGNYVKFYGYFPYPIPTYFYSGKAFFINLLHHKSIYIHELQNEPWGPRPTKDLTVAEQNHYMSTSRMQGNINFGLQTGMKKMYLWGGEWWYWRMVHFHDSSQWNTIKAELQHAAQVNTKNGY